MTEGQAAIGVLPMPQEEDPDPWWRHLLSTDDNAPQVIARLPFGARGNARADRADALAIGQRRRNRRPAGTAPSSSPRTRRTSAAAGCSRPLSALGLDCTFMASCEHAEGVNTLIEIDGFVPVVRSAPRRASRAQLGPALYRLLRFGGYAVPLSAAELSPPRLSGSPPSAASPPRAAKG